jgi:hypothetical protein
MSDTNETVTIYFRKTIEIMDVEPDGTVIVQLDGQIRCLRIGDTLDINWPMNMPLVTRK